MTVISIGHRPSGKSSEHSSQPRASITRLVPELEETLHETCRLPVRPEHDICPHCDAVLKPATQEIKVAPVVQVRRTTLGSAPNNTPAPVTREGANYLSRNRNRPIRPTGNKSVTDIH
jgi:hypothetical protein